MDLSTEPIELHPMPTYAIPKSEIEDRAELARGRKKKRTIVVVCLGIVVALIVIVGVVVSGEISKPQVTAKQSLASLVTMMGDGVKTAGGAWTYDDESIAWVPGRAPGYAPVPCKGTSVGPQKYVFALWGPGSPDPTAAAARMSKLWVSRGYAVHTIYRHGPELDNLTGVSVDLADGAYFVYSVSNRISSLQGAAVCLPAAAFPPRG